MNRITLILEGSCLLRPLLNLATVSTHTIQGWWKQSRVLSESSPAKSLQNLANRLHQAVKHRVAVLPMLHHLLLLGAILLFSTLTFMDTGPIGALTWLLLIATLLVSLLEGKGVFQRPNVVDLLVFAFLFSAVISTAFSSFEKTSVVGLAKLTTFFAGYCVFRNLTEAEAKDGQRFTYILLGVLALLGLGETLVGLYQYKNHIQPLATWEDPSVNPELKMNRIFGTLKPSNPNLLAGFLIPSFAAAFGLGLTLMAKRHLWRGLGVVAAAKVILLGLVLTGSRGGYLAIVAMMVTIFAFCGHLIWHDKTLQSFRKLKAAWLIILVTVVAVAGLALATSQSLQHRVTSIFAMREDSSNSYRMNVYSSATRMFRDNPVVGIGPGNGTFKLVYGLYMVPGYNALGSYSVPLEIAVEQGIVGLSIFLLLLAVLFLRATLFLDSDRPLREKILVGMLITGILGSFVYGFFDTIWYRPSVNLLFWFLVAALASKTESVIPAQPHRKLKLVSKK